VTAATQPTDITAGSLEDECTPQPIECVVSAREWCGFSASWLTVRQCGVEDVLGGGFGFLAGEVGFDADVGVGGEHDAGVAEFVLDDFEVGLDLEGKGGGAAAQVVQPDRG